MAGWFADNVTMYSLSKIGKSARWLRSLFWQREKARVINALAQRSDFGCNVAIIHYEFWVDGNRYQGAHREPFVRFGHCWTYARKNEVGVTISIRYNRRKPWMSRAQL